MATRKSKEKPEVLESGDVKEESRSAFAAFLGRASEEKPVEKPTSPPKPVPQPVVEEPARMRFDTFVGVCGARRDQVAGFKLWAKKKGIVAFALTMIEWRTFWKEFQNKPVGGKK